MLSGRFPNRQNVIKLETKTLWIILIAPFQCHPLLDIAVDAIIANQLTLSEEEGALRADWVPQGGFEHCDVVYELEIYSDPPYRWDTTYDYFVFDDYTLEYCKEVNVIVVPIIDTVSYTRMTGKFTCNNNTNKYLNC